MESIKKILNKNNIIGFILVALLIGCGGAGSDVSGGSVTGNASPIALYATNQTLARTTIAENEVIPTPPLPEVISVGDVYRSQNYYYILKNNSTVDIKNLTITSSNPNFVIQPTTIAFLGAPGNESGVVPILRLAVEHGSSLTSYADVPTLLPGLNTTTLSFVGENGDTLFTTTYTINANAFVSEIIKVSDCKNWNTGLDCDVSKKSTTNDPNSSYIHTSNGFVYWNSDVNTLTNHLDMNTVEYSGPVYTVGGNCPVIVEAILGIDNVLDRTSFASYAKTFNPGDTISGLYTWFPIHSACEKSSNQVVGVWDTESDLLF